MKLLLLAGTAEARELAARLARWPDVDVLASLAGATRTREAYDVPVRLGGFGGRKSQEEFLRTNGFQAVLDVTHPFARIMPSRTQSICARLGVPYLRLLRPGWMQGSGDRWTFVDEEAAAADVITGGARVFLATGRRSVSRFAALAKGRYLIARAIEPPEEPFPFAEGEWVVGRPPFTRQAERRTLRETRADVLVAKDAGGPVDAKLAAARDLGLPVVLLRRPAPPPGERVRTVEEALSWLERML